MDLAIYWCSFEEYVANRQRRRNFLQNGRKRVEVGTSGFDVISISQREFGVSCCFIARPRDPTSSAATNPRNVSGREPFSLAAAHESVGTLAQELSYVYTGCPVGYYHLDRINCELYVVHVYIFIYFLHIIYILYIYKCARRIICNLSHQGDIYIYIVCCIFIIIYYV